jgi:DnaJ-class molecular chaperone
MATEVKCAFCKGTGDETGHGRTCQVCQGVGKVIVPYDNPVTCGYCKGTGDETGHGRVCHVCKGIGVAAPVVVDNR